ncbi:MAG: lytic transglycosylase domain-containing protein [Spirochaetaceae bacterium]|nr:MAG: lytic transglycosylase domain-containing protein [Spirochaetaceae bacterium]
MLVLAVLALTPGCAESADVWGYDVELARTKLRERRYEPFLSLDFSEIDTSEAQRLGDGSAYYLALIFERAGLQQESLRLLQQSWTADPEPWRRRSLIALLERQLAAEHYQDTLLLSRQALEHYGEDSEIAFYSLEALYRAASYADLLAGIEARETAAPVSPADEAGRWIPGIDIALWHAVAAYRLQKPDWIDRFYAVFSDYPATAHHARLFLFARNQGDILPRFDRRQRLLIEARYHLADGRSDQSARLFRTLIDDAAADAEQAVELTGSALLPDLGRALTAGGDWRLSAPAIEKLLNVVAGRVSREQLARLYEYLGRVQRSGGNRAAALSSFRRALELDNRGADRDRVAWYVLQLLISGEPAAAVGFLETHAGGFHGPSRFNGLLDELASQLVRRRDWSALQRAERALDGNVDEGSLAQYAVINAAAARAGLAAARDRDDEHYLRRAREQWHNPYYALVAAVLLDAARGMLDGHGGPPVNPAVEGSLLPDADAAQAAQRGDDQAADCALAAYVAGYFAHGLLVEGYLAARLYEADLPDRALVEYAAIIAESGNYLDSLRLMDVVVRRSSRVPPREWAYLMYPRAFAQEMAAVIQAERLEPELFYALVREESYFSADISSHVGAIGLAQLMPATAAEVARAMRLENPDLIDPQTNLSLGARYLRAQIDRFGSLQDALLAYNAGPTRVRRWRAQNGTLPPLLYQEAVPFHETRHYVRKILVSAAFYGRLYGGVEPDTVFMQLFGEP